MAATINADFGDVRSGLNESVCMCACVCVCGCMSAFMYICMSKKYVCMYARVHSDQLELTDQGSTSLSSLLCMAMRVTDSTISAWMAVHSYK